MKRCLHTILAPCVLFGVISCVTACGFMLPTPFPPASLLFGFACPQLTLYLDKVEDEIAALVRSRADQFVSALSTLQDLEGCVTSACVCIHAVRARLARLKQVEAADAIRRLARQRRRSRLEVVGKMVRVCTCVCVYMCVFPVCM